MKLKSYLKSTMLLLALALLWLLPGKVQAASTSHYLTPYTCSKCTLYDGNEEKTFSMMGDSYTYGIVTNTWDYGAAYYNLDGKVDSISFSVGHVDDSGSGARTLKVYLDDKLQYTLDLTYTMSTQSVSIDTAGGKLLHIYIAGGTYTSYGIADLKGYGDDFHYYEAKMTTNVSVLQDGVRTWTCSQCDHYYTETVPKQTYCDVYLSPYQTSYFTSYTEVDGTDDYFQVMGKKYYEGLTSTNNYNDAIALYNLNNEYTKVTFDVGFLDGYYGSDQTLTIYCDGNLQRTETLVDTVATQTFEVNVTGVSQLQLKLSCSASIAIFQMSYTKVNSTLKAHSYQDATVVEAKVGQTGLVRHKCKDCGASYTETTPALQASLTDAKVTLEEDSYTYTGSAIKPAVTVTYDGDTLTQGTDYTVSYSNNKNAGTARVTVTGKGNYKDTATKDFTIEKAEPSFLFTKSSITKRVGNASFVNKLKTSTDGTVTYTSDNTSVATVSSSGKIKVKAIGTTVIRAEAAEGTNYLASDQASFTLTVKAPVTPKKGKTYTVSNMKYKVTNAAKDGSGTVTLVGSTKSASALSGSVTVPATVKINTYKYKVTAIGSKAFKSYKKITSVTIGSNVKKIGASAFQSCTKLKKITVKTKVLKSVGKYAVKSIYSKAKIKVPSGKKSAYKKLFTSKTGYKKTMKIS